MTRSIITSVGCPGSATITLTQPEIRNAFSDEVIAEITAAFAEVGQRDDVRAVVLAAEGPAFCAGANLNWMRRMADYTREENLADAGKLAAMLHTIYHLPAPHHRPRAGRCVRRGHGPGGGLRHGRGGAEGAGFCLSEVKIGLIPATISPYVLRAMGARAAQRYFLTGERFDAAEALRIGFVHAGGGGRRAWTAPSIGLLKRLVTAPVRPPCAPASAWCMRWPSARSTPR